MHLHLLPLQQQQLIYNIDFHHFFEWLDSFVYQDFYEIT